MESEGRKRTSEDTHPGGVKRQSIRPEFGQSGEPLIVRILLPAQTVGALIGRGGATAKQIREESGVKMQIAEQQPDSTERLLSLTGTVEVLNVAFRLVTKRLSDQEAERHGGQAGPLTFRVVVPTGQVGALIGKQGATIKEMREQTRTSIQVSPTTDMPERIVTVTGSGEDVAQAMSAIAQRLFENPMRGPPAPSPFDGRARRGDFYDSGYGGYGGYDGGFDMGPPQRRFPGGDGYDGRGGLMRNNPAPVINRPAPLLQQPSPAGVAFGRGPAPSTGGYQHQLVGNAPPPAFQQAPQASPYFQQQQQQQQQPSAVAQPQSVQQPFYQTSAQPGGYMQQQSYGQLQQASQATMTQQPLLQQSSAANGGAVLTAPLGVSYGQQGTATSWDNTASYGTEASQQMYGSQSASAGQHQQQVTLPNELAGHVIGKGGARINQIRQMSGAQVKIADAAPGAAVRLISLSGTPEQIQAAQYYINSAIADRSA